MPIPERKELEEAVDVISSNKVAYANLDRSLAHKTLLSLAQSYLSGELVKPMSKEKIYQVVLKWYRQYCNTARLKPLAHAIAQAQKQPKE